MCGSIVSAPDPVPFAIEISLLKVKLMFLNCYPEWALQTTLHSLDGSINILSIGNPSSRPLHNVRRLRPD